MWVGTTYLSAGHIESEAAGWKSGRLHCSLPRSDKSSSRSRLCWLRNNYYFPFASLRGNMTECGVCHCCCKQKPLTSGKMVSGSQTATGTFRQQKINRNQTLLAWANIRKNGFEPLMNKFVNCKMAPMVFQGT